MVALDNTDTVMLSTCNPLPQSHLPLITAERTDSLSLLQHLLQHFQQSIVLCGPSGIGKTTLLQLLQSQNEGLWHYVVLNATVDTTLTEIQSHLADATVRMQPAKTVLAIDNAGALAPYLINELLDYAASQPLFVFIFVLTADELYLKNRSDSQISDCHFVELAPLTETQCADFLSYLISQTPLRHTDLLSDTAITQAYRVSHGVPARLIGLLPHVKRTVRHDYSFPILLGAVLLLVAFALVVQWLSQHNLLVRPLLPEFLTHLLSSP